MTRTAGRVAVVALGVTALRVWHVLLLRQSLDAPLVVAGWLALALLLFLASWRLARSVPPERRDRVERLLASTDGSGLVFVIFFLCLLFLFHWGFERAASDGREYYVQVRSLVIDRDLDFSNENATFGVRGTASRYAFGAPVLWAPFFLLCHLWLALLNLFGASFSLDGFINPYQQAIGLGSLVYGFVGFVLVFRILCDYFPRRLSAAVTLLVCFGSFYVWYLTVENSMVHGAAMFATTLFLYLWHRTRASRTLGQWALLGVAAGLMSMVRWQNALFLAVPLAHALIAAWRSDRGATRIRHIATSGAVFTAGVLVGFGPQFIVWRIVRGAWVSPPAAEHGMHLDQLHLADVLFSPYHGLFSSTPLLYLAAIGLPLFFLRDRLLTLVLAAGFLGQLYVNASIEAWWGGAGFGGRRFESCALLFAVGLAGLLTWARRHPMAAPGVVLGALVALNTTFMLDVRNGSLPADEGVTFDRMHDTLYSRLGNPFSFPWNAVVAWKYDVGLPVYDQQRGRTFNNLTIDLGEQDDARYLGGGWSEREQGPGWSFRWATGIESVLVAPLKDAADDYRIELRCAPFRYPGVTVAQTVTVLVNGREVGRADLGDMGVYAVEVPMAVMKPGLNQIRLRHAYARSPYDAGMSPDRRVLSVQYDSIHLRRLLGTGQ